MQKKATLFSCDLNTFAVSGVNTRYKGSFRADLAKMYMYVLYH